MEKGTSGQRGQNQGPDIWGGDRCTSEVRQRPLCCVSQRRRHKLIFCGGCSSWVHKECSGIPGHLKPDRCTGQAGPIGDRPMTEVRVGRETFEVVPSFCYLGDCLSLDGVCELASITRCRVAWDKFNELLPIITSRSFPINSRGRVYNLCVRSAMLHASKTKAPKLSDLHRPQRSDLAMIHWMCNVTTKDQVSSQDLLERMPDDLITAFKINVCTKSNTSLVTLQKNWTPTTSYTVAVPLPIPGWKM